MPKAKEETELTTIAINQEKLKKVLQKQYCKRGEEITWIGEKRNCDEEFFGYDFEVQFNIEKKKEKKNGRKKE